ncbi:MAG: tRNA (adenosine(37)-N6)-threonylcarbamoyltransferase complex ATPase subunit type 1 TsaE, partial [Chloroflexi bacterium]|nr:tRNA (adenosine(37)-N6)-threonylcarbamoyltransferase complex ATPase subunit type 1 TsaE [Chloroflexota bacterium]
MRFLSSNSAAATDALGDRLGREAANGDVVCLSGELGAGKTTLTQGLARGLGIDQRVTSPT